jgi:ATP-dependent RNA helicase DeaD
LSKKVTTFKSNLLNRHNMQTKEVQILPEFHKALSELGFTELTPVQEKCIPIIQQGRDLIGISFTGSGKTLAFGIPALEKVVSGTGIQVLVLTPTRELCNQIAREFRKFTKHRKTNVVEIVGGLSISPQIEHLRHADVVVGTPGRLLDHLERRTIDLSRVKVLVLDEADKMFEMGFIEDVGRIVSQAPRNSQKLFFGATMPLQVLGIAKTYMNNPERVKMQMLVDKSKMEQYYYPVDKRMKFSLLVHTIKNEANGLVMVFCATRRIVDIVDKNLNMQGIASCALHGGMTQSRRNQVMDMFHGAKLDVLVASDVAARGLDIKNVNLIINYDLPKGSQEYIHRIGRTARAGKEGKVFSLLCLEDHENFRRILEDHSITVEKRELPQFEKIEFVMPQRHGGGGFRGGHGGGRQGGHGGHRQFGERRGGDRSFGERRDGNRQFGERREGSKPFGERRHSDDRSGKPFGERRHSDDRGGRPFGERHSENRQFGSRGQGGRSHGRPNSGSSDSGQGQRRPRPVWHRRPSQ